MSHIVKLLIEIMLAEDFLKLEDTPRFIKYRVSFVKSKIFHILKFRIGGFYPREEHICKLLNYGMKYVLRLGSNGVRGISLACEENCVCEEGVNLVYLEEILTIVGYSRAIIDKSKVFCENKIKKRVLKLVKKIREKENQIGAPVGPNRIVRNDIINCQGPKFKESVKQVQQDFSKFDQSANLLTERCMFLSVRGYKSKVLEGRFSAMFKVKSENINLLVYNEVILLIWVFEQKLGLDRASILGLVSMSIGLKVVTRKWLDGVRHKLVFPRFNYSEVDPGFEMLYSEFEKTMSSKVSQQYLTSRIYEHRRNDVLTIAGHMVSRFNADITDGVLVVTDNFMRCLETEVKTVLGWYTTPPPLLDEDEVDGLTFGSSYDISKCVNNYINLVLRQLKLGVVEKPDKVKKSFGKVLFDELNDVEFILKVLDLETVEPVRIIVLRGSGVVVEGDDIGYDNDAAIWGGDIVPIGCIKNELFAKNIDYVRELKKKWWFVKEQSLYYNLKYDEILQVYLLPRFRWREYKFGETSGYLSERVFIYGGLQNDVSECYEYIMPENRFVDSGHRESGVIRGNFNDFVDLEIYDITIL